ncbi:MAG: transcription antitermination factor NusB [Culturomica sp.]|jgi:N utilization substance protein B|nr:transcription antitermination factor NusB [Culturomica sp.]
MTSRRLIRTKVLHIFYSYTKKEGISFSSIENELLKSVDKSTDLYYSILLLLTEIRQKAFMKIDASKHKHLPTKEDLHPNVRFIENPVLTTIEHNPYFEIAVKNRKLSWADMPEMISHVYNEFVEGEAYNEYMQKDEISFSDHVDIVLKLFVNHIAGSEFAIQMLEDKNIFWYDDFELIFELVYKTIKQAKSEKDLQGDFFYSIYKEEDIVFARDLLLKSILEKEKNLELIQPYLKNWEIDRISEIDKLIMVIAISEIRHFSSIPVKVTLDEFIEIAKSYSSDKSKNFINGLLDKAVTIMKETGELHKTGRGLIN